MTPQEHPLKALMDRPTRMRKISLSLSQLRPGVKAFAGCLSWGGIPGRTREETSLKYVRCLSHKVL